MLTYRMSHLNNKKKASSNVKSDEASVKYFIDYQALPAFSSVLLILSIFITPRKVYYHKIAIITIRFLFFIFSTDYDKLCFMHMLYYILGDYMYLDVISGE